MAILIPQTTSKTIDKTMKKYRGFDKSTEWKFWDYDLQTGLVIKKWYSAIGTNWNTYLYIHRKDLVEKLKTGTGSPCELLDSLPWHYGQTLYEEHSTYIKIGDDYQHYWDEGYKYYLDNMITNINHIFEEFKKVVVN